METMKQFIEVEGSIINVDAIAMVRLQLDDSYIVRMLDGTGYTFSESSIMAIKAYLSQYTTRL
jgi:hypothetical protein